MVNDHRHGFDAVCWYYRWRFLYWPGCRICHKKIIKIAGVIVSLFIAALAYLEYQRIIDVNWAKIQAVSQNGLTWVANMIIHISINIGSTHTGTLSNVGIP